MDTPSSPSGAEGGSPRATEALGRITREAIRLATVRVRGRHLLALDVAATIIGIYVAITLRFDGRPGIELLLSLMPGILLPLAIRPLINWQLGLYRRLWRYASARDMVRVVEACLAATLVAMILFYGLLLPLNVSGTAGFPRSFWVIELLLALALQGGGRFLVRIVSDTMPSRPATATGAGQVLPALLYGAGRIGDQIARSALREPDAGVRPVGFLDDSPLLHGQNTAGLRVLGGLDQLKTAVERTGARAILITMPNAPGERVREIVNAAEALRLEVRTVPGLHELLDGSIDAYRLRKVRVDDLLSRPVSDEHAPGVAELIGGATIMVTGAGGSIGSELARQVYALNPAKIILVDRAESPLYTIQRELDIRGFRDRGHGDVIAHLGNVASRAAMANLVRDTQPDVIFHAAAYKHVPMMESYPAEGVHVNIGGTMAMLDAARSAGVRHFVLVSTDKAVEPSSVMGATKRVAEALVTATAAETGYTYLAVRFGNVLGSAGSVLPIFMDQLERGQSLTVTHPEMTRFFMTIAEASWLILDAAAVGGPGDLFVLDMGKPVRIMDLAEDLVRLSGRPPGSVPIEITGLRPGEKLHERLFYDSEQATPTSVPKLLRTTVDAHPLDIREEAQSILALATGTHDGALRDRLFRVVETLAGPRFLEEEQGVTSSGRVDSVGLAASAAPTALPERSQGRPGQSRDPVSTA
ncbi:MAG TPA: nucleoside-diphosphate sugar epimerase/dehydratase [Candidatus Limnocylindrales bacterium]